MGNFYGFGYGMHGMRIFVPMTRTRWTPPPGFARKLINWSRHLDRPLPWREEEEPYRIWLSEMLLQQTRAAQAIPYYHRFVEQYPTVQELAQADIAEVLRLWEGLGYYNRAHFLHQTARIVTSTRGGQFPDTYEGLLALPGIGPYTAAAIASFAFGRPHAVVDGNVIRILARLTGLEGDPARPEVRREFQARADTLMGRSDPAAFNQAMMDFGAVQCVPRQPDCPSCPFAGFCMAWNTDRVNAFPAKKTRRALRHRYFLFLVLKKGSRTWLVRRDRGDVWRGLFTFPLHETEAPADDPGALARSAWPFLPPVKQMTVSGPWEQVLTHQHIHAWILTASLPRTTAIPPEWMAVEIRDLPNFAFPRILRRFLNDPRTSLIP